MSATALRFETTEPTTAVKLPPGEHKLRLKVVDDAGMESEFDTVVVKVERIGLPVISHVDPARGRRGDCLDVTLVGEYLGDASAVRIFRGDEEDPRVRVKIVPGGGNDRLLLRLEILDHAGLGPRLIEVTTPRGIATAKFAVITDERPRIINLTPTWMTPAGAQRMAARIEGDHLENAGVVRLQANGVDDPWVVAGVRKANREYVDVDVRVSADAAFGPRTFVVEGPSGTAGSPPGVLLSVMPGALQIAIMVLAAAVGVIIIVLSIPNWPIVLLGVAMLALTALLYWPSQWVSSARSAVRWVMMAYIAAVVLLWLVALFSGSQSSPIEYVAMGAALLLLVLLGAESRQVRTGSVSSGAGGAGGASGVSGEGQGA